MDLCLFQQNATVVKGASIHSFVLDAGGIIQLALHVSPKSVQAGDAIQIYSACIVTSL